MFQPYNPRWYWHQYIGAEYEKNIKKELDEYLQDESNYAQPEDWTCDVLSTHTMDASHIPWDIVSKNTSHVLTSMLEEIQPLFPYNVMMTEIWSNKYKKGMYQEAHQHQDPLCNLVGTYFYQLPENSGRFVFYDETFYPYGSSGLDQILRLPGAESVEPEISEGDLVFFPPHYLHHVTKHMSDIDRITISFNLKITKT
tara:strand:- start:58 stop:651 length:594 start_codon:yes stop_codon:yes gene_type:complete